MSIIDKIHMLKKILKEAGKLVTWQETIYTALHNIHADWIVSGRFPVDRLPAMTSGKIWKGTGGNVEEVDFPVGVPSGVIAMWHGLIANIPSGWVICDGNNSTPNLLTKFVEGVATAATDPGATGGSKSKTTSGHYHLLSCLTMFGGFKKPWGLWGAESVAEVSTYDFDKDRGSSTSSVEKSQTKTDSISDIRPPFFDIAFIMKT
ncbi:hypothetical protein ES703_53913 [subsurface metagenome]